MSEPTTHRQYVAGFAFDHDRVLLIKKNKPEWQRGRLNGVGGKIEPGETPEYAMRREFREEAGIDIAEGKWSLRLTLMGPDYTVYFFFTTLKNLESHYKQMTDEQLVVVDSYHLPGNVIYNLRWILPLIRDEHVSFPVWIGDRVTSADCTGKLQ